jgi:chromosome condensin MukBEF complex kleisin-like MukF subunit
LEQRLPRPTEFLFPAQRDVRETFEQTAGTVDVRLAAALRSAIEHRLSARRAAESLFGVVDRVVTK